MTRIQTQSTIRNAKQQAKRVLAARTKNLARREQNIRKRALKAKAAVPLTKKMIVAAGSSSPDLLVAEGDSWFRGKNMKRLRLDRAGSICVVAQTPSGEFIPSVSFASSPFL